MKLSVIAAVLVLGTALEVAAQANKIIQIKSSEDYYWGEAIGKTKKEASDKALAEMARSISVHISSSFELITSEIISDKKDDVELQEFAEEIIQSYAAITIKNVQTIIIELDEAVDVFHYIKKSEIKKLYEARKNLVFDIYDQAVQFEEDDNYADALKWYYFSIVMINSVPEDEILHNDVNMKTELSSRVTKILNAVKFVPFKKVETNPREVAYYFKVTVDGKPVKRLDFTFFDGFDSIESRAIDGVAVVELFGSSVRLPMLTLSVKYSYPESRKEINEINQLWDLIPKPVFGSSFSVSLNEMQASSQSNPSKESLEGESSTMSLESFAQKVPTSISYEITNNLPSYIGLINKGFLPDIQSIFSQDDFLKEKIHRMIRHNQPEIVSEAPYNGVILPTYDGYEYRKLITLTYYKTIQKKSQEYLVFDYDSKGQLKDINFGIIDGLYYTFVNQSSYGKDWDRRQIILKFVERYRTAYLTRDLKMLEQMFSDQAIIIVGRKLETAGSASKYEYMAMDQRQPNVEYLTLNKDQYLTRQQQIFDKRGDISLDFSTFSISRKNNDPNVYGITLRQHYNSTEYSDEGHLFLLVDFKGNKPTIYVRSWQPQEWSDQALIKLANFNINK